MYDKIHYKLKKIKCKKKIKKGGWAKKKKEINEWIHPRLVSVEEKIWKQTTKKISDRNAPNEREFKV